MRKVCSNGWLASFLFGKRISQKTAAETWRVLVEAHGRGYATQAVPLQAC